MIFVANGTLDGRRMAKDEYRNNSGFGNAPYLRNPLFPFGRPPLFVPVLRAMCSFLFSLFSPPHFPRHLCRSLVSLLDPASSSPFLLAVIF